MRPMKLHYFDDPEADPKDFMLKAAIGQGYVPPTCLLAGHVALQHQLKGEDPCAGCNGPRHRCQGRPKK